MHLVVFQTSKSNPYDPFYIIKTILPSPISVLLYNIYDYATDLEIKTFGFEFYWNICFVKIN